MVWFSASQCQLYISNIAYSWVRDCVGGEGELERDKVDVIFTCILQSGGT